MSFIKYLTAVGDNLGIVMSAMFFVIIALIRISWICPFCGKPNQTNIVKHLLFWCDHEGNRR